MSIEVSEIAAEIDRLCKERHISHYTLAKRSGMRDSSVRNMFQKGTTPSYSTLNRMCRGLGITVTQFFSQCDFLEKLPPRERELMAFYLKMDMEHRQRMLVYARELIASHQKNK